MGGYGCIGQGGAVRMGCFVKVEPCGWVYVCVCGVCGCVGRGVWVCMGVVQCVQ